jgi:hypothetical protein
MFRRTLVVVLLLGVGLGCLAEQARQVPVQPPVKPGRLRFEVKITADQVGQTPESGRVVVAIGPKDGEPNFTNYRPPVLPVLGADIDSFTVDKTVTLDAQSDVFPAGGFENLPAGEYTVQAVFSVNRDINLPFAPGNRFSKRVKVKLNPATDSVVTLLLDNRRGRDATVPKETATHKYLSLPSKLLSEFHGRPMVYRVGVVLPSNFEKEPAKKYGLVVHIGGFGTRYTQTTGIAPDPRFVQILPDGAGPWGDPYQVDSANNGPYGQSLTTEVIPHIERAYRCLGTPKTRFTTGASTGGWVSLALQLYYPDFFNGCWSQCPDSLTFERFELIDIYGETNAYVNRFGTDRPGTRTVDGDTVSSVRHECLLERVLGRGGKWYLSGRDWASWNAVYGPKGKDGLPVPLWDGRTGAIDKSVPAHWKKYDLKLHLEKNWSILGPKLGGGKVNVWVGDADDYFLNAAVRRFKDTTDRLQNPKFDGTILIEARKGHDSGGWSQKEILDAMANRMK